MTRRLCVANGLIRERGPLGSWRTYYGEAARVMALVLRYSR